MSGRDLLLEYAFPIEAIEPVAAPSAVYLNNVIVACKPKTGQEGNVGEIYECESMTEVAARTDNDNAQRLFDAGMTKVYILLCDDLYLADFLATFSDAFTLLISDDFDKDDIIANQAQGIFTVSNYANLVSGTADTVTINGVVLTAQAGAVTHGQALFQAATSNDATAASLADQINNHDDLKDIVIATVVDAIVTVKAKDAGSGGNDITAVYTDNGSNVGGAWTGLSGGKLAGGDGLFVGTFAGVVGVSSDDKDFLADQAVLTMRTAFYGSATNGAKNMFFAFGELLSGRDWTNQQYIEMPADDEIDELNEAMNLFNDKISFVLTSNEYGSRLALFTNNRKAIVAPYIFEWFQLSMQGWGVQYIALNQPSYTVREASLMQDFLQQKANERFIDTQIVETITVKISLVDENFTANGDLVISEPKALWRVAAKLQQGLI